MRQTGVDPGGSRRVWYGMVWYGMVWYGMVWYGMVWYGMVSLFALTPNIPLLPVIFARVFQILHSQN